MSIVLDAHAVLAYVNGEDGGRQVVALVLEAGRDGQRVFMSAVNIAEVFYVVERKRGAEAVAALPAILDVLSVEAVPADKELAREAAHLRASKRMSLADCFAAALAKSRQAPLVTADPDFKQVEDEVEVVWLG